MATGDAVKVALVNDYEIIVHGLAAMLAPYSDRVQIVEVDVMSEPECRVDVALFDTFASRRHSIDRARQMVESGMVKHVLLYTWDAAAEFLALAEEAGVSGVVLKSQTGESLVDVIERVARGERIGFANIHRGRQTWDHSALSVREQEVLALIAYGMSNAEIGKELFLSVDTVKTYVRRLYSKLGVRNRAQAALQAARYNVLPPTSRHMHPGQLGGGITSPPSGMVRSVGA
ncbi:MAG TPA: response regulator transcription factor [Ilumatobacteraceae bacterium]|jgi:DNA-binding NarL/FixJ family response regulator